jgi:hypothetical protein
MLHCNNNVGRRRNPSFRNNRFANRAALIRLRLSIRLARFAATPRYRPKLKYKVFWALILAGPDCAKRNPG